MARATGALQLEAAAAGVAGRSRPLRVLHVAAEAFPWVKTGGLADVIGALPAAQARLGAEVRLLLPGYPALLAACGTRKTIAELGAGFGVPRLRLSLARLPSQGPALYLIEAPALYQRDGGPYLDAHGQPWLDNLQRFALLGWAAAQLALGQADAHWRPQLLHSHDWHAALAHAYLQAWRPQGLATVFTIHNLAYQGRFALRDAPLAGLPSSLLTPAGMEFHGELSFMKAALQWADRITTVSPRYAQEISTPAHGCGLEGVIAARGHAVQGILNGIALAQWNPATDAHLAQRYHAGHLALKAVNRRALQRALGLAPRDDGLLVGVVSRLSWQKGVDLLLGTLDALVAEGFQFALQGTGDADLAQAWRHAAERHPGAVAVHLGYDEAAAHRLVAGADVIAVPSRFEPCGLTQLYGLAYGTVPVVRRTGGLADTVQEGGEAGNGFTFDEAEPWALAQALRRAQALHADPSAWQALQARGMAHPQGWDAAAAQYLALYQGLLPTH